MKSLNKVQLIGNVGKDPEIAKMQNGNLVARMSIATSERRKDGDDHTEWHRVVVFGNIANIVQDYVKKGAKLYLEGKMQTRKWSDKAGMDRYSTEVVLGQWDSKLIMLSSKGDAPDSKGDTPMTRPEKDPIAEDEILF